MATARIELSVEDPLAHRALDALRRADAHLTRTLSSELDTGGISATGFEILVVLASVGGELELRALRSRLRTSKANATEVVDTLERRGLVSRRRDDRDRRAAIVSLSEAGRLAVADAFPAHSVRVRRAFEALAEDEKRQLTQICRKLADAA